MKRTIITFLLIPLSFLVASAQTGAEHNFKTAMRAFYLWRCGTAVAGDYAGEHYATEACHLDDGYCDYIGMPGERRDGTGGWHDAGDFGKYTVNAGITVGNLFFAWEHFGDKLKGVALNLPETASGYPEFLEEIKYETDFLFKMQYPDGSGRVSHKLTRVNFAPFIMPQDDHEKRYFTEWGSAATADFVAMMAMAARHFAPYDKAYADKCLKAARLSYKFLQKHSEDHGFVQGDFKTGGYQTSDPDDRLWAAAEMWQTTGEKKFLKDVEKRIKALGGHYIDDQWDWGNVANLGVWTYVLSNRKGRDAALVNAIRKAVVADGEQVAKHVNSDKYGSPLVNYFWGCNGLAARLSVNLHVAEIVSGEPGKYTAEIRRINDYLLGNNPHKRSYVTGLGINPPMHPHDRRSGADGIEAPWPGYLVGGGHTQTDWVDEQEDYSRNEIAINWQAGLVYLFAAVLAAE